MNDKISLSEFVHLSELAAMKYPNAKVVSIGHGIANDIWHYSLFLDVDGIEIRYEIPMYKEKANEALD